MTTALTHPRWRQWLRRHRAWLIIFLVCLLSFIVRVRLRDMALERDEGEYAYAGQLMLHGIPPYQAAYNMKLPGTYAAYAVIMAVFGQTPSGIHFGLALVNVASILLIFLIGRKLLDLEAALAAAVAFGLLSTGTSILGLAAHATHFVSFFALAGIWFLLVAGQRQRPRDFILAGLCFGLSFLMKQHGIFFGIFGGIYLLFDPLQKWFEARHKRRYAFTPATGRSKTNATFAPPLKITLAIACYLAGFIVPYLVTCLLLAVTGAFHSFWFWTVSYAAKYASNISFAQAPELLGTGLSAAAGPNLGFWILAVAGALILWWDRRRDSRCRFFLAVFALCSIASVSVGLFFRAHYFITLLPALALLAGEAFSRSLYLLKKDRTIELFTAVPILGGFALALAASLIGNMNNWLVQSRAELSQIIYGTSLFKDARTLAEFIGQNSEPGVRLAVVGSEPEIYFYSRRRSATGYIYTYPLMENQAFAHRMQEEMIQEIESAKPDYVVYVDDTFSWLLHPDSDRGLFRWWENYWVKNLDLVKTVSYSEGEAQHKGYVDPFFKESTQAGDHCRLMLFERKDRTRKKGP